ncbi:MAG: tetratricopeptide repeat protein [Cyclobacteriaceae bacterium]
MKRWIPFLFCIVLLSCQKKTQEELFVERAAQVYNLYDDEGNLVSYDEAMERFHRYAKSYNERGVSKFKEQLYGQAVEDFTTALKYDKNYAIAYSNRGYVHAKRKEYVEALADLNKAVKLNPKYAKAYQHRAWVKQKLGYPLEAVKDASRALNITPRDGELYLLRAANHYRLGNNMEAFTDALIARRLKTGKAKQLVDRIATEHPEIPQAIFSSGR